MTTNKVFSGVIKLILNTIQKMEQLQPPLATSVRASS